jgi:diacylglycerol kinase (ATP)
MNAAPANGLDGQTRVIVNPAGAAGRAVARAERARGLLEAAWPGLEWRHSQSAQHLTELCRDAAGRGYARVVIAGGDGSLHFAVRGLAGSGTALGILPTGTGNDFAMAAGIPLDAVAAARALVAGEAVPADLGMANGIPFCCVAGIGMDATALDYINQSRWRRGKFLYQYAALRTLLTYPAPLLSLEMDGVESQGRVLLAVFANTPTYAGGNPVSPGSSPFDGRLDYCVFWDAPRWRRLATFAAMRRGRHSGCFRVSAGAAQHVRIGSESPLPVTLDGEPSALATPVEVSIWPAAIRLLCPCRADNGAESVF